MRTVAAPRPNRVGHVVPQAVQTDTDDSPFSGSVVPSWSQHSMRSVSVSRSMWIVNVRFSLRFRGTGRTARHEPSDGAFVTTRRVVAPTAARPTLVAVAEAAGVIAAVAALGALYFAWRTVVEARAAHAEDQRDRQLSRFEALGVALTELAAALQAGGIAPGRVIQARARVLWATAGGGVGGSFVREAVVTPITAANADEVAVKAEAGVEVLLVGLEDYLASASVESRS